MTDKEFMELENVKEIEFKIFSKKINNYLDYKRLVELRRIVLDEQSANSIMAVPVLDYITIMRYIGVRDSRETKIHEHDLIRILVNDEEPVGSVYFDNDKIGYTVIFEDGRTLEEAYGITLREAIDSDSAFVVGINEK